MKIVLKVSKDENESACHRVEVDGKQVASIFPLCECPEDATIERSLIGGKKIIRFMKMAFEAGRRGEDLTVDEVKDDEED